MSMGYGPRGSAEDMSYGNGYSEASREFEKKIKKLKARVESAEKVLFLAMNVKTLEDAIDAWLAARDHWHKYKLKKGKKKNGKRNKAKK